MTNLPPPLVTAIIPVFNKSATVARAIASVKNQTLSNLECFVIDNNSTDNSQDVILNMIADDDRFQYFNCGNQGVAYARNMGIRSANAPYIMCLDADDEIHPEFLSVCVDTLLNDTSIGAAYTGLEYIDKDGNRHRSEWPGRYHFDQFENRRNQLPTCCVFRRDIANRLGGYRQRYAPWGAGSEDANFWYRMGVSGFRGVQSTDAPLFRYYSGGQVSSDSAYSERNWIDWYPWIEDKQYPIACLAKPLNDIAHLAHQYDNPVVSIVIPIVETHLSYLVDAIDSVEGQSERNWELILVWDGEPFYEEDFLYIARSYPYAQIVYTDKAKSGAGVARNMGAQHAKTDLLLFLDADDWLAPHALRKMLKQHKQDEAVVYSDYVGHAYIEPGNELTNLWRAKRVLHHDERTNEATIYHNAAEFYCERAVRQPDTERGNLYIWNLITSLVPKSWHDEINGFDESMESWEDWDYWIRMARTGKCFVRIPEPLVEYRFYSGSRRSKANPDESGESGRQLSTKLLQYLLRKREESMARCGGCKSKGGAQPALPAMQMHAVAMSKNMNMGVMQNVSPNDLVTVKLIDGNIGDHPISFRGQQYGYKKHGDVFKMLREHAKLDRRVIILDELVETKVSAPKLDLPSSPSSLTISEQPKSSPGTKAAPEKPSVQTMPVFDLTSIWGINQERAEILIQAGVRTPSGIVVMGAERLAELLDVKPLPARRIVSSAKNELSERED